MGVEDPERKGQYCPSVWMALWMAPNILLLNYLAALSANKGVVDVMWGPVCSDYNPTICSSDLVTLP